MRGIVKWFDDKLGYGFIKSKEIENDVFVHFSEIKVKGYKSLKENDLVDFDYDQESSKATNVVIVKKASESFTTDKKNYSYRDKKVFN